jgi:glutamate-ammonia-ligase adenylyltransferase
LLFGAPEELRRHDDLGVGWLDSDQPKIDEELANSGFPSGAITAVAEIFESYRRAAPYRRLDEAGRRRLHVILARLLEAAARHSEPAIVVQRVVRVLEAIGARASYLALLKEQPAALDRLIEVCAISGFLSRQIADFPLLLDELIDARVFDALPSRQSFALE